MFIVEKGLSGGYFSGTGQGQDHNDFSGNFNYNATGDPSFSPQAGSGSFLCELHTLDFNTGNAAGATCTWNRMSDGALVMQSLAGFQHTWQYKIPTYSEFGYDKLGNVFSGTDIENQESGVFGWYKNVTIFGAKYKCRVMGIGYDNSTAAKNDAKKYLVGAPDSSWVGVSNDGLLGPKAGTSGGYNKYYYGVAKNNSVTFSSRKSAGVSYSTCWHFRMMLEPTGAVPTFTNSETKLGVITEPTQVTLKCAQNATFTMSIDGEQKATGSGTNFVVDLTNYWEDLSLAAHTVIVTSEANGYKCGARITFTKSESLLQVTGNKVEFDNMPTFCKMVDNCVVPSGAIITREVTNNANDGTPTWETYVGDKHAFDNTVKIADKWAVQWRISIDNSHGDSQARIQSGVGMAIMTQGVEE